jgi:hypothetical protein
MGFFDFIEPLLPALVTAGVTLFGADQKTNAQNQATATANKANAAATAAQQAGVTAATNNTVGMQGAASPGLIQQENVIGMADKLTPEQQLGLADAQRTELDALQGGNLRGSARATVAAVDDVQNRGRLADLQANQQRADAAGQALSGQYFTSGNNLSNLAVQSGKVASAGLVATGQNDANATLNNANTSATTAGAIGELATPANVSNAGTAINNISSVISGQAKQNNTDTTNNAFANSPDMNVNPSALTGNVDLSKIGSQGNVDGSNTIQ